MPEPGRRIVSQELGKNGDALPWLNLKAFAQRALEVARTDLEAAQCEEGSVFFDRGLVDAAVALQYAGGPRYRETLGTERHYRRRVWLVPPWPEIFESDTERRHGFVEAEQEFVSLEAALLNLGYETLVLPRVSVRERVALVLKELGERQV